MKNTDQLPATYSVRMPPDMRKTLEDFAKQGGRSLHSEILLRLEASISNGDILSNELSKSQESRVREIVRQELAEKSR